MRLTEVLVGGSVEPWEKLGLTVDVETIPEGVSEHLIAVPGLVLKFSEAHSSDVLGLCGWTFASDDPEGSTVDETTIDGISTRLEKDSPHRATTHHRLGVLGVDHVVVMTGSLERTCAAITDVTGEPLKRIRDAGRGVRQGFHRAGSVIIEVVERPDLDHDQPASLWGLVFDVADLDEVVAWLGPDAVSAPRDAVQEGRRIASIRSDVGLGVAVALMTPQVRA